jgi:sugar lactone lactonase YvrE
VILVKPMVRLTWILAALATLQAGCDCGGGDDDDDADGGACPITAARTGSVQVTVDAAGGGTLALVLTASDGAQELVDAARTVDLPTGPATVSTERARSSGPVVGTIYVGTPDVTELCVVEGETVNVHVTVLADPASNKLWVTDGTSGEITSIAAGDLGATGAPTPVALLTGSFTNPGHMAFGPDGMLWVTDESHVEGYANADLATGGAVTPAITLTGAVSGGGVPGAVDIAFDRNGSLWVVNLAASQVMRFDAASIAATGEPEPSITVSGPSIDGPQAIALDTLGNVWVSGTSFPGLVMFEAGRLGSDVTTEADLEIIASTPAPVIGPLGGAAALAFDAAGNLWAAHYGPNVVARYATPELTEGGEITPVIQVHVPLRVLLDDITIDEDDGLWLTGGAGQVARLSPDQLSRSGDATPETILSPVGLAYAGGLVFYPAATGTPIPF